MIMIRRRKTRQEPPAAGPGRGLPGSVSDSADGRRRGPGPGPRSGAESPGPVSLSHGRRESDSDTVPRQAAAPRRPP
jgi:hypothetical protein